MLVTFKYFYEESEALNTLWESNLSRILFLHDHLSEEEQLVNIQQNMTQEKDILAMRFPPADFIKRNKWINSILLGRGLPCHLVWKPKEVWIYGEVL